MNKIKEYIELIKSSGYWENIFTPDDWSYILDVVQKSNFGTFLEHIDMSAVLENIKLAEEFSLYFQEDNSNIYFKGISNNFKCFTTSPTDLHFALQAQIAVYQRNLKYWPEAWEDMKEACYTQIKIASEVVQHINGSHTGFKRLAISLEKEGNYCEVVSVCKQALQQGWTGDWKKRIDRNSEKTNNIKKLTFEIISRPIKAVTISESTSLSKVPEFEAVAPKIDMLSKSQEMFFNELTVSLNNNQYLDLEGNLSYAYLYIFELIYEANSQGYEWLSKRLKSLSELYKNDAEITKLCHWHYLECLLGLKKYHKYLEYTEPKDCTKQNMVISNLRLNLQLHLGLDADPIDLITLFRPRSSSVIQENKPSYQNAIRTIFSEYKKENGALFPLIINMLKNKNKWDIYIFSIPYQQTRQTLEFKEHSFSNLTSEGIDLIKALSLDAENTLRKTMELPDVGAGWLSETKLFTSLKNDFSFTKVIQHASPSWLGRQHFDVYFPEYKVAIEYHGLQHFEPVEFFGGEAAFQNNVKRDARKVRLAKENTVELFVIREGYNYEELKSSINSIINKS